MLLVPVAVLPWKGGSEAGVSVVLKRRSDGLNVPCQVRESPDGLLVTWMLEELRQGETERFTLAKAEKKAEGVLPPPTVAIRLRGDADLAVDVNGGRFFDYHFGKDHPKPYAGPIIGPHGDPITRLDFQTTEHPHQRSMWIGIGDVNGVDLWNEPAGRYGKQLHQAFGEITEGPVYGQFVANNLWTDHAGDRLVDESRTISVYATPAGERIIDVEIVFTATFGKVVFGPTKEAGPFAVRVADSMNGMNTGVIENAYGALTERENWGKRAPWCDYSGSVNGHRAGIAIFDHPTNERHPTFWHVRDGGLMAPNNFYFSGLRELESEGTLHFRYRVAIHYGNAAEGRVSAKYHDFANPPVARIVA